MIPGLDGLRAIAFLILFGLHIDRLHFGWMGVQLFFVLSGFLITDILLRMKQTLPLSQYLIKFYLRRFLRIFPLYYFFLFLMLGISFYFISIDYKANIMQVFIDQASYAFLYLYNFLSASIEFQPSRLMDHLWSLSVEEQFYIFWPLLIFVVPEKNIKNFFITCIGVGFLFRVLFFVAYQFGVFETLIAPVSSAIYPLPLTHIDAFAFGAYISRFSITNAKKQLLYLGIGLPIIGFGSQYIFTGSIGNIYALGYPVTLPNAYQFLWAYTLLNYWFALLIYCVVYEKMFIKFLEIAPLRYLGKISYGLYVYHFPIIWFSTRIWDIPAFVNASYLQIVLLAFVGTIVIASLSYYLLEKPLIQLKDKVAAYRQVA